MILVDISQEPSPSVLSRKMVTALGFVLEKSGRCPPSENALADMASFFILVNSDDIRQKSEKASDTMLTGHSLVVTLSLVCVVPTNGAFKLFGHYGSSTSVPLL